MRIATINITLILVVSLLLFASCNRLILGIAHGLNHADSKIKHRKLDKNNKKFDRDGWYTLDHNFNADSLYSYFIKSDSAELSDFYQPQEFNFVLKEIRTSNQLDTFTCFYTRNIQRGRITFDFSPTRNAIELVSNQEKDELSTAYHCYFEIDLGKIASCFVTKDIIYIPYILIKKDTIIAKPKPYLPLIPFESYKNSLPSIKEVNSTNHTLMLSDRIPLLVDTTDRFSKFLETLPLDVVYTEKIEDIDTNLYEVNHRIQYNYSNSVTNFNYYRYHFIKLHYIQDLTGPEDSYWHPSSERYFKPEKKLLYKKRIDLFFKELSKKKPHLLLKNI